MLNIFETERIFGPDVQVFRRVFFNLAIWKFFKKFSVGWLEKHSPTERMISLGWWVNVSALVILAILVTLTTRYERNMSLC